MRLSELKSDIKELGYSVKETSGALEVYDSLEGTKFFLNVRGEELEVSLRLFSADQIAKMKQPAALAEFLPVLAARPLGCRIATLEDGGIWLVDTLPPDQADAQHIEGLFSRIHLVEFNFAETLAKVGRTGRAPGGEEIDKLVHDCRAEAAAVEDELADLTDVDDLYDEDDDDYEIDDDDLDY